MLHHHVIVPNTFYVVASENMGVVVQHFWFEASGSEPGEVELDAVEGDVDHEGICTIQYICAFMVKLVADSKEVRCTTYP